MNVNICENTKSGEKSGKACAIIFFDAQGDIMIHLESINLEGVPIRTTDSPYRHIIYYGCHFKHNGTQELAGNMLWNGYDMPNDHALGLINTLHFSRQWSVSEAWVEIARAWMGTGELPGSLFELPGVHAVRVNPKQTELKLM